ncbi:Endonuclease/exonuclease/phosphatase [Lentinula raphanica]|nr:Endonuclease/exonuclease/phosphatase [Lentinula raphanica]
MTRKSDTARLAEIERRLRIEKPEVTKPNWAADLYATKTAAGNAQPSRTTTNKRTAEKTPKEVGRASQFVVHFAEEVPEDASLHPNLGKTRVATAKWNYSGNLVISTVAGQSASSLEPFFGDMHEFYTTTGTKPQDTKLNQVWYKIIIDGVTTGSQWRLNNGIPARPHNSTELKEELTLYNPSLAEVKFALDPRFVVQASELTHRRESSIQFAVSDPLLAEHIIKGKVLNLFGKACKTRKYQERTPSTPQCRKCKALGHREDKCTACPRCALWTLMKMPLKKCEESRVPPQRDKQAVPREDPSYGISKGRQPLLKPRGYERPVPDGTEEEDKSEEEHVNSKSNDDRASGTHRRDKLTTRTPQTPIQFAQLNVNKKKAPVLALLNEHINEYDILLIQEPNWSFVGKEGDQTILGTVNHATAWTPISPIPSAPDTTTPRVYAYVNNSIQAEVTLRTDIVSDRVRVFSRSGNLYDSSGTREDPYDRDIMVLDVKPKKGSKVTFINVYNDPSLGRQQVMWRLRNLNLATNQAMVVTGDMNLHHVWWSRGMPKTSTITDEVVEWLDQNMFGLINKPGTPTHYPHDTEKHPSVIDLTWVNPKAAEADATQEWAIDHDLMAFAGRMTQEGNKSKTR